MDYIIKCSKCGWQGDIDEAEFPTPDNKNQDCPICPDCKSRCS